MNIQTLSGMDMWDGMFQFMPNLNSLLLVKVIHHWVTDLKMIGLSKYIWIDKNIKYKILICPSEVLVKQITTEYIRMIHICMQLTNTVPIPWKIYYIKQKHTSVRDTYGRSAAKTISVSEQLNFRNEILPGVHTTIQILIISY